MASDFFKDVTWAQIIVSAVVAAGITLVIEYFIKPELEARKIKYLEKSARLTDAKARLDYLNGCLRLVTGFSAYSANDRIIPTNKNFLLQQLDSINRTAQTLAETLPRVMRENDIPNDDADTVHETIARIASASTRTSENIQNNKIKDFRTTNTNVLKKYLSVTEKFMELLEKKK